MISFKRQPSLVELFAEWSITLKIFYGKSWPHGRQLLPGRNSRPKLASPRFEHLREFRPLFQIQGRNQSPHFRIKFQVHHSV
jgi:hypothetical protein